jgi:hypothetical protein
MTDETRKIIESEGEKDAYDRIYNKLKLESDEIVKAMITKCVETKTDTKPME